MTLDPHSPRTSPTPDNAGPHPWRRFVALGDSFTEGIGDPLPDGGHRGWADRVAEVLGAQVDDFAYANLAVRGKLIAQIVADQIEPALALKPDLITISAGGNDVIRPGSDPDAVSRQLEDAVARLRSGGATVVVFTAIDTEFTPVFRGIRGKVAIYNENIRSIADRYDCVVADQWGLKEVQDMRFFDDDRLHYNALGHHEVARMVLRALNVPNDLEPLQAETQAIMTWRAAREKDFVWAREYLVPWVLRRLRHQSSGDHILPKRPEPLPVVTLAPGRMPRARARRRSDAVRTLPDAVTALLRAADADTLLRDADALADTLAHAGGLPTSKAVASAPTGGTSCRRPGRRTCRCSATATARRAPRRALDRRDAARRTATAGSSTPRVRTGRAGAPTTRGGTTSRSTGSSGVGRASSCSCSPRPP